MRFCLAACVLLALALAMGCASRPVVAPPSEPAVPFAALARDAGRYLGHDVIVEGLPVYPTAVEVSPGGQSAGNDPGERHTYFVLVNREDPLRGLLVRAHTSLPLDRLRSQAGSSMRVAGPVAEFPGGDIQDFMRVHHGVRLLTGPHGGALWIEDRSGREASAH